MRAIIIEEERFTEICDLMKLKAQEIKENNNIEITKIPQSMWDKAVHEVHHSMHYYFVRWAQSHGASCTK